MVFLAYGFCNGWFHDFGQRLDFGWDLAYSYHGLFRWFIDEENGKEGKMRKTGDLRRFIMV